MSVVRRERHGAVAEVVLNRPEKLNALNRELLAAFADAIRDDGSDDDVSCIIVRGEGRAFCVGHDMETSTAAGDGKAGTEGDDAGQSHASYADWRGLSESIAILSSVFECPKPVIASVHGYCMGMGMIVAVCSDLTVIGAETRIGWPVLPYGGGILGPITSVLIGAKKAKELSYIGGSTLTASDAVAMGWANYAVPDDAVLDKARELASAIARTPLGVLRIKKLAINRVLVTQGLRDALENAAAWDALAHTEPGAARLGGMIHDLGFKEARRVFEGGG